MHNMQRLAILFTLSLLAGCSNSSTSSLPQSATQTWPSSVERNATVPQSRIIASTSNLLYVGNVGKNSITVYKHDAQGDTSPLYVIAGSNTGIDNPGQLSEDAQGNLYVANGFFHFPYPGVLSKNPAILVFAHGAHGNVAPIRKLTGPLTQIHNVRAMTVDMTTGKLFVFDGILNTGSGPCEGDNATLLRFPPNATGNVAPYAAGPTGCATAIQISSDSTGQNLIQIYPFTAQSALDDGITTLAKQFPNNTPPATIYQVSAIEGLGVADDPTTKTYLTTTGSGVYRLAENTTGSGPAGGPNGLKPPPVSIITSETCGSEVAVAPGPTPNTYITHSIAFGGCPADAVYVYSNSANGNVTPLRVLRGAATGLNEPYGIYEGQ